MKRDELRRVSGKEEVYGTEEAIARIMSNLAELRDETIDTMTDLTPEEIFHFSRVEAFSTVFNSHLAEDFFAKFKKLRASRYRLGRKEFVLLASGLREFEVRGKKRLTLGDLFGGLR